MNDPRDTLAFALDKYPHDVEALPIDQLVLDTARESERRPAYVQLAVPDDWVKNLRGKADQRDVVLLVRVPRRVEGRAASPIVLPGEVR